MLISITTNGREFGENADFPTDEKGIQNLCDRLNIENRATTLITVEEVFGNKHLNRFLQETEVNLDELNYFLGEYSEMYSDYQEVLHAMLENRGTQSVKDAINISYNLDYCHLFNDLSKSELVGQELFKIYQQGEKIPPNFNGTTYFETVLRQENAEITSSGILFLQKDQWSQCYDGKHLPARFAPHLMQVSISKGSEEEFILFPTEKSAVTKALERLDIENLSDCQLKVQSLPDQPHLAGIMKEAGSFETLNSLAQNYTEIPMENRRNLNVVMNFCQVKRVEDALTLMGNFHRIQWESGLGSPADYGEKMMKNAGLKLPSEMATHFDYTSYGQEQLVDTTHKFTNLGLLIYQGRDQNLLQLLDKTLDIPLKQQKEPQEIKLFMPLLVETCCNESGQEESQLPYDRWELPNSTLLGCEALLNEKLSLYANRDSLGKGFGERGLMAFYQEKDAVNRKVESLHFSFEEVGETMYGVAKILVTKPLTGEELSNLKEFVTGQASDGLGEGFGQREISLGDSCVNVSFWNSDRWYLKPGEEMDFPEQRQGPEMGGMS